ncbi:ubiquitin carboxyl-terminal hydrolase 19-like isoform X2 [Tasmannia lanceolata]|uniref:ubiquitin carboxyl-terminal hydrolase 19-like isoform X2 n=1 Tax=Tasmannia lanceolata TaxID=3420 RepID=UPI00406283CB
MHVLGIPLDLSALLQFVFIALVFVILLIHLVKITASRYLVVEAKFEGEGAGDCPPASSGRMLAGEAGGTCFVCGSPGSKKCSRCKVLRYCSKICQSKHWQADHKLKCKGLKSPEKLGSTTSSSSANGRRTASGRVDNLSTAPSLVPARGNCKVLFPYDEFVKLFNWESTGFPPCGLLNCGNSCFANVVLQCLASTRPLVAYLLEKGHSRECNRNDWCFLCELQSHIQRVSQSLRPFSPINILSRLPNIGGNLGYGKQEDAHEFMRFAIDTMQSVCLDEFGGEKVLDPSTQETTLIQHIFGGQLQSQVMCTKCKKISYRYENMMDLTVEIQGDASSLEDCLDQFTVNEWLDGENMYKCDGCNDYVKAWKRLTVHQPPNILTIALKRFQSGRFGKLNKRVTFPEILDLGKYMSEAGDGTNLYRLYAVVVHVDMLNASYFGHYICYTKDLSGNWYRIDDCKVMNVELEEVLSQGAYMLLYSRVFARQPTFKPLEPVTKEIPQSLEVPQESIQGSMESVEAGSAELADSVSASECLSSDISQMSTDSGYEGELPIKMDHKDAREEREDMDLVDTIKVNSEVLREVPTVVGLDISEESSLGSTDLEEVSLSHHSLGVEDVSSDEVMYRYRQPTSLVLASEPSTIRAYMSKCQDSCTSSNVDCNFKEENGTGNIWVKEFQDSETSSDNFMADKMANTSPISVDALSSEPTSVDNANISLSTCFSNPRSKQALITSDPSLSQNGSAKLDKLFPETESALAKSPIQPGETSSGRKSKQLFSRGFLDKPARKKSVKRDEKAQPEPEEICCSSKDGGECNGLVEPVFAQPNNGKLHDQDASLETFGGDHEDHSPDILDKPSNKSLNGNMTAKKEPVALGSPCYADCNGHTGLVFPDQNGSTNDVRIQTLCENNKGPVLDCTKPLLSPGFLDKPPRKKPLNKDGEVDLGETNGNGFVDHVIPDQNGNMVHEHGISSSFCQNDEDFSNCTKPLIYPGFLDKPSRRKLHKTSEVVQEGHGGGDNSLKLTTDSNGLADPILSADGGNMDTFWDNDKGLHLNCKRQRQEVNGTGLEMTGKKIN